MPANLRLTRLKSRELWALQQAILSQQPVLLGKNAHHPFIDQLVPLCTEVELPWHRQWLPPAASPGPHPLVSVVIPALKWPLGIEALKIQDVPVEILVLANGGMQSVDSQAGTAVKTLQVAWEGHGKTRQRGVEAASGTYVFLSVDDAIPLGLGFLRRMVKALEEGGYDAVFARQVPWPLADPVTRKRLAQWTPAGVGHRCVARHDHVAALYRRETLLKSPLPSVPIAEDWHWGRRHRIGYVADAPVLHSHPREFWALYQRTKAIHRELISGGEVLKVGSTRALLSALPGVVGWDFRGALGELLGQWVAGLEQG
jgi:hypothetical protein